ncbi:MAG: sensor histidine kinase [Panacibacter sp.]
MKTRSNTLKLTLIFASILLAPMQQLFAQTVSTDSLLSVAKQEQYPLKKTQLYYLIAGNYKEINADSALMFYVAGLKNAIALQQDSLRGLGYYYLAGFENRNNNYNKALMYIDSAYKYLHNTRSYLQLAELKSMKGVILVRHLSAETKLNRYAILRQKRTSTILLLSVLLLIIFAGLLFNRYKLKKKIESQQALLNERKRISHELHDDLGSQLCATRIFLNTLKNNGNIKADRALLENSLSLIDTSIKDLRFIMDDLQTSTLLENGYLAATAELVNKVNQLRQINFSLSYNGIQQRLEHKKENNLFRITQELINNTLKYAHAKNVTIDVLNRDNNIVLMYEDDGNGFNPQSITKGYGLNNIQSRSQSLGGTVAFDSWPGAGFRAIIEIPLLYA